MRYGSVTACLALLGSPALAESPMLNVPHFPQFALVGIGAGPGYIGSDDRVPAAVPALQLNFGERYLNLEANYLSANLLENSRWQAGPAGILRFGRGDEDNDQIDALPDIDMSVGLGGFLAYEVGGTDPRDRWRVNLGVLQDVTLGDGGMVADIGVRHWTPVGRYGAFGLAVAASWGSGDYMDTYFSVDAAGSALSGLPVYTAGSGWRDLRAMAVFVQPISEKWAVGAGVLYSYLLDEAGNSPVALSRDQVFFGVGVARAY